ncbi:MAG: YjjG family noncanonical pyrimidine nucleotidase [Oscillospiraceae bacterium]|nr:YjjG family noncanonical pyrimidine nucleotidase [Oscillospiraceae bacterium]
MENMTISRAAAACGGTVVGSGEDLLLRNIVIDSRAVEKGDLFIAYRGERVDGHDYMDAAFSRGAACCLAERIPETLSSQGAVILVPDVQLASEKIAAAYRSQFDSFIIGITGSVGKTTAKEMISAVVEQKFCTLKTEGNLNNRIGIPMMLSRLGGEHQVAVIEMGISEFGEMSILADMVRPSMAVFTNIGHAHLEFLHDLDGVLRAKSEMLDYLPETAPVVVNGDDVKLRNMVCRQRKIMVGFGEHCEIRALDVSADADCTRCVICSGLRRIPVVIPAIGRHTVYAALSAAAVGMLLGLSDEQIIAGIAAFRNVDRRGGVSRHGAVTLLDDGYNANPDSVRSSIDSLMLLPGRRHICMLGDMLELGEESEEMHRSIGEYAEKKGADLVVTSGPLSAFTAKGAGERGIHFETRQELIDALSKLLCPGDCILVKASKSSHFETVAAAVRNLKLPDLRPVVLLDLDDTILDFKKAEARALSRTLTSLKIPHDDATCERYNVINLSYWERLERGEISRAQVLVGRFEQLLSELGQPAALAGEVRDRYERFLSEGHFFVEGAPELLEILQEHYRLFLVSNGTASVQAGRLASAGIAPTFEKIFISEKMGAEKPSALFFERCFAEIPDFRRENCIIIGDSLTSDILGGIRAGIRTCWFNLRHRPAREEIRPDYTVSSLSEIPALLRNIFAKS